MEQKRPNKRRQRTAEHHIREFDRLALGLAEEHIWDHNFRKLVLDGTIVREKEIKKGNQNG